MTRNNIRAIAYRKYQLDWLMTHDFGMSDISDLADEWYDEKINGDFYGSFFDYIKEYGFHGVSWACFSEFMENEYRDKAYMKNILSEQEFAIYEQIA